MSYRTHKRRSKLGQCVHASKSNPRFILIPKSQPINCHLPLSAILDDKAIKDSIVFHMVGDTGGVNGTETEDAVANAMEQQTVSFMYHLGDVVYFNGQSSLYEAQFYEPYKYYPAPIFAIPGNHDGDNKTRPGDTPDNEPSLYGFFENFCSPHRTAISTYRDSMTQPYVYWTLTAPFITIIGLYGNVDGSLDGTGTTTQQQWLTNQLKQADPSTCIIVTVHQPPYSLDASHGGYPEIGNAIDEAAQTSGVYPHAVFSGHVHNYQRFTRKTRNGVIPYIIAGAGGYANSPRALHKLQLNEQRERITCPFQTTLSSVTLQNYNEDLPGFLRLTVDNSTLKAEYFTVDNTTTLFDSFVLNYKTRTI